MSIILKKITEKDAFNKRFNLFFEASHDYFWDFEGVLPSNSTLNEILNEVPEGYSKEDKLVFEINKNGNLVGIIDILKGFPTENTWMIGLVLLHPKFRGQGLGCKIHTKIKSLAKTNNIEILRIGVIESNYKASKFWNNLGYQHLKKVDTILGEKNQTVNVMTLNI